MDEMFRDSWHMKVPTRLLSLKQEQKHSRIGHQYFVLNASHHEGLLMRPIYR
jgi:hypothetical protein